jgi:PAS domain S-box-containing protein
MTTAPDESQTTSSAIFQWRSLKTRVTVSTLTFFLIGIWSLAFYASYTLKNDMERTLGEQQFSTVSIIAAEVNAGLDDRMKALEQVAALITPAMLANAATMQTFIERRPALSIMFNGGVFVLLHDGAAIADYPLSTGRRGLNFIDRKYAIGALKEGKTTIGSPVMGKALRSTLFSIATPIYSAQDKVIGALAGTVDLAKPNFLSRITDNSYGKTGDYYLNSRQSRQIVTSSDKSRIMEMLPAPGINPAIDRYIQGYEGSSVLVNPLGVEQLASAKGIPVAGWYLAVAMPTAEAFAPIRAMQQRMLLAAIFLTLLAGGLTWWMLKRQLAPVFSTIKTLAVLADTDQPPQSLPITRQDEIGELIGGFNHLLETLGQRGEALKASEEKYRNLFNNAEDGIFRTRLDGSEVMEVNQRFLDIVGMTLEETLEKPSVNLWVEPKEREEMLKILVADGSVSAFEYKMLNKRQGEVRNCLTSLRLYREQGILEGSILDITDRRRAEDALRESQERYRTLIETTGDLIYTTDRKGFLTYMNPTLERTLGYAKHEWNGKTFAQIIAPECIDSVRDHFKRAMKGDSIPTYEVDLIRKDGTRLSVEFNVVTIYDSDGKPSGRYGIGRDITDRKRVKEALRESEKRLQRIVDGSPIPAFVIGKDHQVIHWNKALEEISRIRPAEVLGTREHWRAFYNEERPCMADLLVDGAVELVPQWYSGKYSKSPLVEDAYEATDFFPAMGQDGKWLRFTAAAIRDSKGMIVAAIETLEDITDRKKSEAALTESEARLRTTLEILPVGVFIFSRNGQILTANAMVNQIWGVTNGVAPHSRDMQEFVEYKGWWPGTGIALRPEDWAASRVLLRGETAPVDIVNIQRFNGSNGTIIVSAVPLHDTGGDVIGAVAAVQDITAQKQAEEEHKVLQERLQRAEKMEALGTLAGGVAHDLNNVLGVVVGYAELVLMKADESSSIRPQLVNIMNGGLKAAAIVDDLLTLARRGVSDREVLNLNKIIADCQKSPEFEKLYSYHPSVKIKTDIDPDLPNISGSSVHLGKSLYNLISNASEAMAKGGTVTIRTTNQYLDKPIQGYDNIQEGDYVVLSVSDTGEGISADNLKRIFEPFYTKKVMGRSGTGLGLAVVWGTVKDHHGYINVESEEGKGSTFTLYFPVTREAITAEAVAIDISEYMGKGESILVVDDVKEQRDLAAGMLRTLNYSVTSVSSGEEAIAYLKDHQADLMVLDMIMDPGMDGLDTYRKVLEIRTKQKAIIVSGFSESDRVRAAKALGVGAYVRKPYIKEKLGLAVRKELDRK